MMKKLLSASLCLLAMTAHSQDELTITGDMKWMPNDSLVQVYEGYTGAFETTTVKDHKFTLNMKLPKGGSVYILSVGTDMSNPEKTVTVLYLEPGKMVIKEGSQPGFKHAKFSGSQFVADWDYVTNNLSEVSPRFMKVPELEAKMQKATQLGDEDALEAAKKDLAAVSETRDKEALAWIRKNPNSGVAAYVIMAWFNIGRKSDFRDSLINTLGDHAKKSRIAQRMLHPGEIDPSPVSMSFGEKADKFAAGTDAPSFTTLDENGKEVTLADFKGKYVFLDFWASWCGPCVPQIPFLKAANDKYKSKNFVMLGISLDSDRTKWMDAVKKHNLDWKQLSSLKSWKEPAALSYEVGAIPFNILIGPDGKIIAKGLYDGEVEKILSQHIK